MMTGKKTDTPSEYVREFISVLKIEIDELKKSKDNNVSLKNGVHQKDKSGRNLYRFDLEQPFLPLENVLYKLIVGAAEFECELVSVEGNQILLATMQTINCGQNMKLYIDRTTLPEKLLHGFESTLQDANQRYANAARLFNGQFKINNQFVPNLSDYDRINDYQKSAVVRSFQGDTIIWGPPGTGKTHTIAVAINEQIKKGRRVLLLSHANTAVDGAMEELADLLNDYPVYTEGHLVRMGASQLDKYPMLSLDEIVRVKAEALYEQIKGFEAQLLPLREQLTGFTEIRVLRERYLQEQRQFAQKEQLYHSQNKKIQHYKAEVTQQNQALSHMTSELSRLENKIFQTGGVKKQIELMKRKINETTVYTAQRSEEIMLLQAEQGSLSDEIFKLKEQTQSILWEVESALARARLSEATLEKEIVELTKEIGTIEQQIKDTQLQVASLRKQVIEQASVIGATLSMTFMSNDLQAQAYDTLFIDEISMAPLLPMFFAMGLIKANCTLIGDFLQLPPISTQSKNERLQKWQNRNYFNVVGIDTVNKAIGSLFVKPLCIQYRMNPAIAAISNELFYSGILKNGSKTVEQTFSDRWVLEQPLVLIDTSDSQPWMNKGPNGQSRCNPHHAMLAASMARHYLEYKRDEKEITIGVVVPYRPQKDLINDILDEALGKHSPQRKRIEVNTVHSFQGGEKDVIICDSVESEGLNTSWSFFDEGSKNNQSAHLMLNVAVTRAKCKFILLANMEYVEQHFKGRHFKDLLDLLKERGAVIPSSALGLGYHTIDEEIEFSRFGEGASAAELGQYNQDSFWAKVIPDLKNASKEVIIFCPFVGKERIQFLLPVFKELIQAGVDVIVYTRAVNEHATDYCTEARRLIDSLRRQGVTVRIRKRMHEKVILIDDSLVWQGSLNLLSHKSTTEQMQRISSEKVRKEISDIINLEDYAKIAFADDPAMRCELCGGLLIVRQKNGEKFYGCKSFPDCGFTRPI